MAITRWMQAGYTGNSLERGRFLNWQQLNWKRVTLRLFYQSFLWSGVALHCNKAGVGCLNINVWCHFWPWDSQPGAPSAPPAAQPGNARSDLPHLIKDDANRKTFEVQSHVNNYFPAIIFISLFLFAFIALIFILSADVLAIKQQAAIRSLCASFLCQWCHSFAQKFEWFPTETNKTKTLLSYLSAFYQCLFHTIYKWKVEDRGLGDTWFVPWHIMTIMFLTQSSSLPPAFFSW